MLLETASNLRIMFNTSDLHDQGFMLCAWHRLPLCWRRSNCAWSRQFQQDTPGSFVISCPQSYGRETSYHGPCSSRTTWESKMSMVIETSFEVRWREPVWVKTSAGIP